MSIFGGNRGLPTDIDSSANLFFKNYFIIIADLGKQNILCYDDRYSEDVMIMKMNWVGR